MAFTICAYCDASYLEQYNACDKCGLTLDQQLFKNKYTPFKHKAKIFWKWVLEVIFFSFVFLMLVGCAAADEYKVIGISDGDTIKILKDGKEVKVRLAGIDCPEKGQPFGTKAKTFTSEKAFGKNVKLNIVTPADRYGRMVADVILPDGTVLSAELVKAGLAWHYKQFSKSKTLEDLENDAKENKRGLWADSDPVPPWNYRKRK
jgi:endonuclease YncB( thermonuclease family)